MGRGVTYSKYCRKHTPKMLLWKLKMATAMENFQVQILRGSKKKNQIQVRESMRLMSKDD